MTMPALGMTMAQAGHDTAGRAGPAARPLCTECDGAGIVDVAAYVDRLDRVQPWPKDVKPPTEPCPICIGGSQERV